MLLVFCCSCSVSGDPKNCVEVIEKEEKSLDSLLGLLVAIACG